MTIVDAGDFTIELLGRWEETQSGDAIVPGAFVYALAGDATHIVSVILERGQTQDPEVFLSDAMRAALTVRFSD